MHANYQQKGKFLPKLSLKVRHLKLRSMLFHVVTSINDSINIKTSSDIFLNVLDQETIKNSS